MLTAIWPRHMVRREINQRAEEQFRIALKLRPVYASALMGLGNLCLKNGEEDKAIDLLQKAVQAAPTAFEPRFLLGSAYNRLGRYNDALAELPTAVRLGDNESEVYYHLHEPTADSAVRTHAPKLSPGSHSLPASRKKMRKGNAAR
jgi:Flp pilus assembly protein TadD